MERRPALIMMSSFYNFVAIISTMFLYVVGGGVVVVTAVSLRSSIQSSSLLPPPPPRSSSYSLPMSRVLMMLPQQQQLHQQQQQKPSSSRTKQSHHHHHHQQQQQQQPCASLFDSDWISSRITRNAMATTATTATTAPTTVAPTAPTTVLPPQQKKLLPMLIGWIHRLDNVMYMNNNNNVIIINNSNHDRMVVQTCGIFHRIKNLHNPISYIVLALMAGIRYEWCFRNPYYWFGVAFCIKWYRAKYVFKIPVWDRQPNWNNIITSREQEKDLKAYTCKNCGSTIFIAKSREFFFEGSTGIGGLGCFACGSKGKDNFIMDRDRIVDDVKELDDYFEYERPLDFVSRAERRKLLQQSDGDIDRANQLLLLERGSNGGGGGSGSSSSDGDRKTSSSSTSTTTTSSNANTTDDNTTASSSSLPSSSSSSSSSSVSANGSNGDMDILDMDDF
jgi:hypothetical protein